MRAVRSKRFEPMIFEFRHDNPIVQQMQEYCREGNEFMHCDSLALFEAERNCRRYIAPFLSLRSSFLQTNAAPHQSHSQGNGLHLYR